MVLVLKRKRHIVRSHYASILLFLLIVGVTIFYLVAGRFVVADRIHGDKRVSMSSLRDVKTTKLLEPALGPIEKVINDRKPIIDILTDANLTLDIDVLRILPTWENVGHLYGKEPVIVGLETCSEFRERVPVEHRYVGVGGQMNSGTNALTKYFLDNIRVSQNPDNGGVRGGLSWHKHGWSDLRGKYKFAPPSSVERLLPVILVRDPYFWMKSMCESPYLMQWEKADRCPNLVDNNEGTRVRIRWGQVWTRQWPSLAHVWSSWYGEYYEADFPRLIIRFEDLLFHAPQVIDRVRECVGANWKEGSFVFSTKAVKQGAYYNKIKPQSSLVSAIIKNGHDQGQRMAGMFQADIEFARRHLNQTLMDIFHYNVPKRSR